MTEYSVEDFGQFHEAVRKNQGEWYRWYYRGHSSPKYELVPKAGRPPYLDKVTDERRLLETWKLHAVPYLDPGLRPLTDWDYLAIAQHHGLASRLLDWTFNALAAAFFAVVNNDGAIGREDAIIYGHYSKQLPINPAKDTRDPFSLPDGIFRLAPSSLVPRIGRQGGIFTVHSPRDRRLDQPLPPGDDVVRIVIPAAQRKQFAIELSHYGVNRMSLFPDLDGLSAHINWSFAMLGYDEDLPIPAADPTKTYYETRAVEYAAQTQNLRLDALWTTFSDALLKGPRVLDLGCGSGRDAKEFARRGFSVIGVDYSQPLVDIARAFSGQDIRLGEFRALEFPDNHFDGIWALASLLHVPRPEIPTVLKELHRLLRPRGVLLTSMQKGTGIDTAADGRVFELYMPDEWETLLRSAGFLVEGRRETTIPGKDAAGKPRDVIWMETLCGKSIS